jgi:hypothetical protein
MDKLKFTAGFDEYELVLPRGCQFKIIKKYRSPDYVKYYDPEAIKLQQASDFYSDIGDVPSDFLSRASVKSAINKPVELTVLEMEFVKQSQKQITPIAATDPGVLTEMKFFLGEIVGKTKNKSSRLSRSTTIKKSETGKSKSKTKKSQHKTK